MFAQLPLQPNEFQSQLRLAFTAISERAAANKVQLPVNFYLGFDDYATSLPNSEAAPSRPAVARRRMDREYDHRGACGCVQQPDPHSASAGKSGPKPDSAGCIAQRKAAESRGNKRGNRRSNVSQRLVFVQPRRCAPGLQRNRRRQRPVLHHPCASGEKSGRQRSEARDAETTTLAPASPAPGAKGKEPAVSFIVGTEHIDVAAKIEILKFTLPEKEPR